MDPSVQIVVGLVLIKVAPSYRMEFQRLFHFVLFGIITFQNQLSIEKEKIISSGISKYLKFWMLNIVKDNMYAKAMGFYIEYWEVFYSAYQNHFQSKVPY